MSQPWCRLWADAVDDDKLRLLAFEDRWHFVAMLCLKCQGLLDGPLDEQRKERIGIKLGLTQIELGNAMKRLVGLHLLTESWQPTKWRKRQFKSDSSTSRVRAFRKRFSNVSETDQKQKQKQKQNTEEDKNQEGPRGNPRSEGTNPRAIAIGLNQEAWRRFQDYRKQIGKPVKPASLVLGQRKLAEFGSEQMAVVEQSIANGWQGLFAIKHPKAEARLAANVAAAQEFLRNTDPAP